MKTIQPQPGSGLHALSIGNNDPLAYLVERQSAPVQVGQKFVMLGTSDDPEEDFGEHGSARRTLLWSLLVVGIGAILLTVVFSTSDLFHPEASDREVVVTG